MQVPQGACTHTLDNSSTVNLPCFVSEVRAGREVEGAPAFMAVEEEALGDSEYT